MARPKRSTHPAIDVRAFLLARARHLNDLYGWGDVFYPARTRALEAGKPVQVSRWQLPREVRDDLRAADPGDACDRFEVDAAGRVTPDESS